MEPSSQSDSDLHGPSTRPRILVLPAAEEAYPPPLRLALQPGGLVVEVVSADMLVGRHSQADLRLPLPEVSRRHCRFRHSHGQWEVIDLRSLNGTFVNGERVDHAVLSQGDLIRIGGFTFTVSLGEDLGADSRPDPSLVRRIFKDRPAAVFPDQPRRAC